MLYEDEKLGLLIPAFLLGFAGLNFIMPASSWFSVNSLDVHDAVEGDQIIVDYDRTIRRSFTADWRVKIRREAGDGLEWVCATKPHREDYDLKSRLPEPVTLEWFAWTDPRCYELPAGDYEITAIWQLNPGGIASLLFSRTVTMTDQFKIMGAE